MTSPTAAGSDTVRAPLVVVSNRLPFEVKRLPTGVRFERSPGGLVAALEPVLEARGGVWIGWPGFDSEPDEPVPVPAARGAVRYHAVPLTAREVTGFYAGFANRTLWPLFHYFVARTQIDLGTWRAYDRINGRFAEAAAGQSNDDAVVWIHDYHLTRMPAQLRRLAPRRRIAFFLHIPFPAADVFRILPWSRQILRGMLGADLLGFHIPEYAENFLSCAERLLGCETDRTRGMVQFENRQIAVEAHPISIDVQRVEALARSAAPTDADPVLDILGVDRLDYTKGIVERILAVERLLEKYPRYRGRILFTQLMVPSRERVAEYQAMKREIDELVGRVNGRFSDRGWSPIRYIFRSVRPEELAALYRDARVALVTPLRDGMNLVAKEYVAARVDGDGVVVLSELAGAAAELQEALLVNPHDIEAVADTLDHALAMPEDERRARMTALRARLTARDVHAWVRRFLESAEAAAARRDAPSPLDQVRRRLERWLAERPRVAAFLDFDGTLAPIVPTPAEAVLSDAGRQALELAHRAPNVDVFIVSGRPLDDVRDRVGIEGITYLGDHGFEIEGPGISYRHPAVDESAAALDAVARDLDALRVPGALVERKHATLAFHVRNVDPAAKAEALRRAEILIRRRRLRPATGKELIEARPAVEWHKGQAVLFVLVTRYGADWPNAVRALYVGDDATDEDAFRSLRGMGRGILVAEGDGQQPSHSDFALPGPDAVHALVRWLAAGGFAGAGR
jgi:trehalose 6-phosphate synthase/phosphatase